MKKRKLNYRFHNPNPTDVATEYILKLCIEVNAKKVERIVQEEIKQFAMKEALQN